MFTRVCEDKRQLEEHARRSAGSTSIHARARHARARHACMDACMDCGLEPASRTSSSSPMPMSACHSLPTPPYSMEVAP